ncbi:hypothetical protein Ahia01_000922000 [Argonauta hians]
MRRYSSGSSITLGRALVFFGAWNIIGITLYKWLISAKEKKEPGKWENASGVQQYLRLINFGEGKVKKVTVSGFTITEKDVSPEELKKMKGYSEDDANKS